MARLYSDENFPFPVVEELRKLGHDMLTIQEAGLGELAVPDNEVLELACESERALVTINRKHFIQLHRTRPNHSGIVVCTLDLDFEGQASRIHEAVRSLPDLKGRLIRINRPNL